MAEKKKSFLEKIRDGLKNGQEKLGGLASGAIEKFGAPGAIGAAGVWVMTTVSNPIVGGIALAATAASGSNIAGKLMKDAGKALDGIKEKPLLGAPIRAAEKVAGAAGRVINGVEKFPVVGEVIKTGKKAVDLVGNANQTIGSVVGGAGNSIKALFEGVKTFGIKAEIHLMMEQLKTVIIQLLKNLSDAMIKQTNEVGEKVVKAKEKGEFSKDDGPKDVGGLSKDKGKETVKDNLPTMDKGKDKSINSAKDTVMNRTSDLSKTLGSAAEKASTGLSVASGTPGLDQGLNIGKR